MVSFPLDKYPEVELLDPMVVLFIIFEEPLYCFPQWPNQDMFPPTVYEVFSISSPAFVISNDEL